MKVKNGIIPRHFNLPLWGRVRYTDHRDISYHRTFGSVAAPLADISYSYDAGFGMPDQNADGYPNGCTGYAQADVAQDFDRQAYLPPYTYKHTLEMSGLPDGSPCDIRVSMKSTTVYGVQRPGETTETEAETHRQGSYLNVDFVPGMDWFDSIRLALRKSPNRSLSLGTPWFPEWEATSATGIVTSLFTADPDSVPWHNHKFCGEVVIADVPYLVDKSWQGMNIGDKGWLYFDRATVNRVMAISGTECFVRAPIGTLTKQALILDLWETILSYMGMYLNHWHLVNG